MKLGQNICPDEIWHKFEMGHVGSKTRSQGQILEKPILYPKGHIFQSDNHETWSECLPRLNLGRVRNGPCWIRN